METSIYQLKLYQSSIDRPMYIRANDSRADRRGTDDTPYEGLVYTANNRDREKQPHLQYRQLSGKSNRPDRQKRSYATEKRKRKKEKKDTEPKT